MVQRKKTGSNIIGIDLGGTKVLTLVLNSKYQVVGRAKKRMEGIKDSKDLLKIIATSVGEALKLAGKSAKDISVIGVGCAGMIDFPSGLIQLSPNIPALKGFPLQNRLRQIFKTPVLVENDVNAGLYGEHQLGAAKGLRHVVGVFPGTGVGGALILDNQLYRGSSGAAGEVGHIYMNMDALTYGVRERGTLEAMTGRLQMATEASKLALRQAAPNLARKFGTDPKKIKSKALKYGLEHDPMIEDMILDKAEILGLGLANLANILNPEAFILGGGVIEAMGRSMLPVIRDTMKAYGMPPNVKNTKVKLSALKDDAVALGAAKLAQDYYLTPGTPKKRAKKKR